MRNSFVHGRSTRAGRLVLCALLVAWGGQPGTGSADSDSHVGGAAPDPGKVMGPEACGECRALLGLRFSSL